MFDFLFNIALVVVSFVGGMAFYRRQLKRNPVALDAVVTLAKQYAETVREKAQEKYRKANEDKANES